MRVVRSVVFNADSVEVQYMDEADVRVGGYVYQTHHLTIARDHEYDDEIAAVEEAVDDLMRDVLEDYATSIPHDPGRIPQAEDDDDDDDD